MHAEQVPARVPYPSGGAPRTPGVHVSGLIRSLAFQYGLIPKGWVEDLSLVEAQDKSDWWAKLDQASQLRMALGLAWEEWYLPNLGNVVHQPGEMCVEGVYMTHDGESLDTLVSETGGTRTALVLHEVKTTYKSTRTVGDLTDQWMWMTQMKAYCESLGTRYARLHILYLCGDYSYPIKPLLQVWDIEFTQGEIEDAWQLLSDHLQDQRRLGKVPK